MSKSIKQRWLLRALLLAGAISSGACETAVRGTVYIPGPPPESVRETVVVSPGEGYVWISGHHQWQGASYVWIGGRWERPPHARARWESGRWKHRRQGWYWIEGRWR
jgi:hypothetical protein